ncbi:hypothetical protein OAV88_03180 [bacterium]|jgi:hypothetical protein|nr:hypothetical protein [bacterium]
MFWKVWKKKYASELDEQMYPGDMAEVIGDDLKRGKKKKKKFGISSQASMERIQLAVRSTRIS